jgi:uncharacterized protein (TIGR02594 family)
MNITAYQLAERWIGIHEKIGKGSHPFVLGMLQLDASWIEDDETPWCSAFVNFIAWQLRLPRSKSLAARSWLGVGVAVALSEARAGFDVVVLKRGGGVQPGPLVLNAPGHVGFYGGREGGQVMVLAGNQSNAVTIAPFPEARVLGIRRLAA